MRNGIKGWDCGKGIVALMVFGHLKLACFVILVLVHRYGWKIPISVILWY